MKFLAGCTCIIYVYLLVKVITRICFGRSTRSKEPATIENPLAFRIISSLLLKLIDELSCLSASFYEYNLCPTCIGRNLFYLVINIACVMDDRFHGINVIRLIGNKNKKKNPVFS